MRYRGGKSWSWWRRKKVSEVAALILTQCNAPNAPYELDRFLDGLAKGLGVLPDAESLIVFGEPWSALIAELETFRSISVSNLGDPEYVNWANLNAPSSYRAFATRTTPSTGQQISQLHGAILRLWAVAQPTRGRGNQKAWECETTISNLLADTAWQRCEAQDAYQEFLTEVTVPLQPRVMVDFLRKRLSESSPSAYANHSFPELLKMRDEDLLKAFQYLEDLESGGDHAPCQSSEYPDPKLPIPEGGTSDGLGVIAQPPRGVSDPPDCIPPGWRTEFSRLFEFYIGHRSWLRYFWGSSEWPADMQTRPTVKFLKHIEAPTDGAWDFQQVLATLLSLGLQDAGIVIGGMPFADILAELKQIPTRAPSKSTKSTNRYSMWKSPGFSKPYRTLSIGITHDDLCPLYRLVVWTACLASVTDEWNKKSEIGRVYKTKDEYMRQIFEPIYYSRWKLPLILEHPPTGDDRAELITLAMAITPVPDIPSVLATAQEILTRRPELAYMVSAVVEPLLLLQQYGYLVSDQLPRPSADADLPERPLEASPLQPPSPAPSSTQSEQVADAGGTKNIRASQAPSVPRERRPRSRTGIVRSEPSKTSGRITARALRGPLITPSAETLAEIARDAETLEDLTTPEDVVITESALSETTVLKTRAYAIRRRSAMRQGVWSRSQWDALTPPEMRYGIELLWEKWQANRDGDNPLLREAAALGLMCAGTGFSASRAHCLRVEGSESSDVNEDRVRREDGLLSMALPGTDPRFTPSEEQQAFLAPVGDRIQIYLPQELSEIVACLPPTPDGYLFASPLEELQAHIRGWLASERDAEPRFTLARMHRAHQLEMLLQSGDVGLSQLACGDPLGVATTPTSYYSARTADIQKAYSKTIERHGFTPSLFSSSPERVGSRLMLTAEAAASIAPSVCRRLIQSPRESRTEGRHAIELHSEIVPSVALMFMAATTFRPTFRLGKLTATAFCLPTSIAVITDKISDEEHFARLVPVCPMLKSSMAAYGQHLARLVGNQAITSEQRAAAAGALAGTAPLLFLFEGAGVRALELKDLDPRLPDGWILPRNFLRHRTATALRESGCPGIYVQALLGHIEAGLQPFGEESFMDPQDYLQTIGNHLDDMLKMDGWLPLMGGSSDIQVFERHRPPLEESFSRVAQRIEKSLELRFREQRKQVDELRKFSGAAITQTVEQKISEALPDLVGSPDMAHVITSEQVTHLGDLICQDAEGIAEVELRIAALLEFLLKGRKDHGWKVKRLPRFHVFRPTPSVFHAEFVPGYAAIDQLRSQFAKELAESKAAPDGNRSLLQLILALILWHGVADETRLLGILSGIRQAQRVRGLSDAIVVSIFLPDPNGGEPKATAEVLRGAVALAAAGARRHIPEVIKLSDLQPLVSDWIPKHVFAIAPTKTFAALLAAAALTHRFESPPPLRAVWTGEVTSVSLSADRVASLMRGDVLRTGNELEPAPLDPETSTPTHSSTTGKEGHNFKWLKGTIRYKRDKIKTFPIYAEPSSEGTLGKPAESKTVDAERQAEAAIRKETIERLEQRLAAWPEDHSFVRALTSYAFNRMRFGTPWNPSILQDSLYTYVLGAGSAILAQDPDENLSEMAAEDFHDLYQSCLDTVSADYNPKLADYLAYFHSFLVAQNLAPSVAIGRRGRNGRCFPDVGYVSPNEIQQAIELLKEAVKSAQDSPGSTSDLEAATAGLILGFASGARTGEALLRQVRELVTTDGRRALVIRRNPFVRVKTKRGTRLVGLEDTMPADSWDEVTRWLNDTKSLRGGADADKTALFLDAETLRPMDTARLTRWITAVLREVTGVVAARPYWARHTSASNEFLALMADDDLMADMRTATPTSAHGWLPTKDTIIKAIGPNVPMGQAHAAEYRSRRGHSRMRTSLETYIHVVGLIQPPGSRDRAAGLPSTALGALAGMAPAAGRKRLSRAGISSSQAREAVTCLLDNCNDFSTPEVANIDSSKSPGTVGSETRNIANATVGKAILRGLRTGELGLVSSALHLTEVETAKWQTALREAANSNIYGVSLPGSAPSLSSETTCAPRATVRQKRVVPSSRVDESWILECAARAIKNPALSAVWDIALRGVDPDNGCIAVNSEEDFMLLARNLTIAINAQVHTSKYVCSVVVMTEATEENISVAEGWLAKKSVPLIATAASDFSPPAGWLGLGIQVTLRSNGKRVRKAVLLAALLVRCLRSL